MSEEEHPLLPAKRARGRRRKRSKRRVKKQLGMILGGATLVAMLTVGALGLSRLDVQAFDEDWREFENTCSTSEPTTCILDEAARLAELGRDTEEQVLARARLTSSLSRQGRGGEAHGMAALAGEAFAELTAPDAATTVSVVEAYLLAGRREEIVGLLAEKRPETVRDAAFALAAAGARESLATLLVRPGTPSAVKNPLRLALLHTNAVRQDWDAAAAESQSLPHDFRAQGYVLMAASAAEAGDREMMMTFLDRALEIQGSAALATTSLVVRPWTTIIDSLAGGGEYDQAVGLLDLNPAGKLSDLVGIVVDHASADDALDELSRVAGSLSIGKLREVLERQILTARATRIAEAGDAGEAVRFIKQVNAGQAFVAPVARAMAQRGDVDLALAFLDANDDHGAASREARIEIARIFAANNQIERALEQAERLAAGDSEGAQGGLHDEAITLAIVDSLARAGQPLEAARVAIAHLNSPSSVSIAFARLTELAAGLEAEPAAPDDRLLALVQS